MNIKYYKARFYYDSQLKTYIIEATHIAQAKKRLLDSLKIDYRKISRLTVSELKG